MAGLLSLKLVAQPCKIQVPARCTSKKLKTHVCRQPAKATSALDFLSHKCGFLKLQQGFWSHVFCDFTLLLGPRGLHFRGPGHPWVAFWPLWVPRPIPAPHLVDLFDDFETLWAPSGSPEQQKEPQRSSNGSLWSTFLTTFRR